MYYVPLDVINGYPHFCCVPPPLPNSVTDHKWCSQTSKQEALPYYVFNVKKKLKDANPLKVGQKKVYNTMKWPIIAVFIVSHGGRIWALSRHMLRGILSHLE